MTSPDYTGPERRKQSPDLEAIWELLLDIKATQDVHLAEEKEIKPKLMELLSLLERSKGIIVFVKWTAAISVAFAAFLVWAKEHIKL